MQHARALVVGEVLGLGLHVREDLVELVVVLLGDVGRVAAKDLGRELDGLLHLVKRLEHAVHVRDVGTRELLAQAVGGVEDHLGSQRHEVLIVEVLAEHGLGLVHVGRNLVHPGVALGVAVGGHHALGLVEHDRDLVVRVPAVGVDSDVSVGLARLGHEGHLPGEIARGHRARGPSRHEHLARKRAQPAEQRAEERRLAHAVGPQDATCLAAIISINT